MLEAVRLLSAGFCLHPEAMTLRGGSWSPCEFPAGFGLICHHRFGAVLYDTGYSKHFFLQTRSFPNSLYAMITPPTLAKTEPAFDQLSDLGIAANDVRTIIVSHFHSDHLSGLRDFPKATIICSERGWQSVRQLRGFGALLKGFLPELMPADTEQRLLFVEALPAIELPVEMRVFGAGRDIFGDGTLITVELPGHTASQLGLLINANDQRILLVADAAWSTKAIETDTPPPALTTDFLGDTKAYRKTLQRLSNLRRTSPELLMFPSHCGAKLNILKKVT
jgi:glyoxylase-like metal-dependent hydrolase (beta-lactamase superfamily II)